LFCDGPANFASPRRLVWGLFSRDVPVLRGMFAFRLSFSPRNDSFANLKKWRGTGMVNKFKSFFQASSRKSTKVAPRVALPHCAKAERWKTDEPSRAQKSAGAYAKTRILGVLKPKTKKNPTVWITPMPLRPQNRGYPLEHEFPESLSVSGPGPFRAQSRLAHCHCRPTHDGQCRC
jgi:hypothetical protein